MNTTSGESMTEEMMEAFVEEVKNETFPPVVEKGDNLRRDHGKDKWSLLPFDALQGIVKVLMFGAQKYAPRGWEEGMDYDRVFDPLMRHMYNWWHRVDRGRGPGRDPDTGYSDLWHAGCNILFLIAYELRGIGKDTRPNVVD